MSEQRLIPVKSEADLRRRVEGLVRQKRSPEAGRDQLSLKLSGGHCSDIGVIYPTKSLEEFLEFLADATGTGDVYLFGGAVRDMALFGRESFCSDIDLVIDGGWSDCEKYLISINASRNKFGGYRLIAGGWPIDIWNASDTWAIRKGLVSFAGIESLTKTTVLNWDAILMSWRNRRFIYRPGYLKDIQDGRLDIVLEENPNPLGMAVRVFRHLFLKDARQVSLRAISYMSRCARKYGYNAVKRAELNSYGNSVIEPQLYEFFGRIQGQTNEELRHQYSIVKKIMADELQLE